MKEAQHMLRRQAKKAQTNVQPKDSMSRQEAVIWLGRAMSTNEVTLRVVLELLDVVAFQQALLKNMTEQGHAGDLNGSESPLEIEPGTAEKILEKLAQLREQVTPTLKVVEDACRQFEGML
jgi:hypothetical protein